MVRICAWCGRQMDLGEGMKENTSTRITHGICEECMKRVLEREVR